MVLSGLRGVGKTVLLNALRGLAVQPGLGDRQVRGPPRPVAAAAAGPGRARRRPRGRPPAPRPGPGRRGRRGAQGLRAAHRAPGPQAARGGSRPSTCPRPTAAPTPATSSSTSIELFTDVADLARDLGVGIAVFVDEMQDISPDELAALCGACHEISQQGAPLIVVGAGLPHLPVALARQQVLRRAALPLRRGRPARPRDGRPGAAAPRRGPRTSTYDAGRARRALRAHRRLPLLRAGLRQGHLGLRRRPARSGAPTSREAAPEAEAELAVGFFGARYDRATPAERDYMRAMADLGAEHRTTTAPVPPPRSPRRSAASRSRSPRPATG